MAHRGGAGQDRAVELAAAKLLYLTAQTKGLIVAPLAT
jgi:hypothetical protein